MSIEEERKAFEDWASKETGWDLYWSENINQYMDHQTNAAWLAWQASANREGYKLVPVVDTDAMWSAGRVIIEENGYSADASDVYKAMIGAIE